MGMTVGTMTLARVMKMALVDGLSKKEISSKLGVPEFVVEACLGHISVAIMMKEMRDNLSKEES